MGGRGNGREAPWNVGNDCIEMDGVASNCWTSSYLGTAYPCRTVTYFVPPCRQVGREMVGNRTK